MEKANQTTEKRAQEGTLEVLDSNLEVAGTDQQKEEAGTDEEEGDDEVEVQERGGEGSGTGAVPPRTVQLVSAGNQVVREGREEGPEVHLR